MIKNYVIIALRNLFKYKSHSLINILGLAIGIAVFVMIIIFVFYELSADRFHQNYHRIYRVDMNEKFGITAITLMQRILDGVPELESGTRLMPYSGRVEYNENKIDSRLTFVDSTFFRIFSFEALAGDLDKALNDPDAIVLLESFARKIFGDEYPLGKEVKFYTLNLTVKAVIKDPEYRTQLWAREAFVPFINLKTLGENFENDWWGNYVTYLLFPENCDHSQMIEKVESYTQKLKEIIHENYPSYTLRPFADLYFEQGKYDHSVH
ncbi:MAG: ABC transporter permease, partial [Candidatus Cloacimonetes bacterium]|nr:ABC transporter permease [Candidatus Cloacimonadota bacterium]